MNINIVAPPAVVPVMVKPKSMVIGHTYLCKNTGLFVVTGRNNLEGYTNAFFFRDCVMMRIPYGDSAYQEVHCDLTYKLAVKEEG